MTNAGAETLVVSVEAGAMTDEVIGLEAVVDLQAADAGLPDWWAFQNGACREFELDASADMSGSACPGAWGNVGVALVQDYTPGAPRGGANQARIRAVVAVVPSDSARTLQAGVSYSALRLLISRVHSAGLGACSGCDAQVCLLLNSVILRRLPGSSGDLLIDSPLSPGANQVTWQTVALDCSAVPVQARTWGQLKQLYR